MVFTKDHVFEVCSRIAPLYNFEINLIKALCLQEGGRNKDGTFAPDKARLEQGYYLKYVEGKNELATTSEVLLSASFGVTQMMGLSLKELGFFEWYFNQSSDMMQSLLGSPLSQFAIPSALDSYCEHLDWQIEWGCKWLDRKRGRANGDINRTLSLWNGDSSGKYAIEVLTKKKVLDLEPHGINEHYQNKQ